MVSMTLIIKMKKALGKQHKAHRKYLYIHEVQRERRPVHEQDWYILEDGRRYNLIGKRCETGTSCNTFFFFLE